MSSTRHLPAAVKSSTEETHPERRGIQTSHSHYSSTRAGMVSRIDHLATKFKMLPSPPTKQLEVRKVLG